MMSNMKSFLFISLLISLTLAACDGGVGRDNGKGDTLASADAIAMLREVETMYIGDEHHVLTWSVFTSVLGVNPMISWSLIGFLLSMEKQHRQGKLPICAII